jgi:RNA polymerase primary sigma factor
MKSHRSTASDILAAYTADVAKYPILSREEEYEIGTRALQGDEEAVHLLVNSNLRFVIRLAKQYDGRGVSLMDLINAGNIGLLNAARRYDPSLGYKLISYATRWITQQIQREIDISKGDIRETPTQHVRIRRVRKLNADARQKLGREYTVEELRELTDFTEDMIREALEYRVTIKSFDEPVNPNDESTTTLAQIIGAEDGREEAEVEAEMEQVVRQAMLSILSPREMKTLEDYYGFGGRREMSLTEIGSSQNVTRERARQIKERALKKVRAAKDYHPMLRRLFTTIEDMEERRGRTEELAEHCVPAAGPFGDSPADLVRRERELSLQRRRAREAALRGDVVQAERVAPLAEPDAHEAEAETIDGAAPRAYRQASFFEDEVLAGV